MRDMLSVKYKQRVRRTWIGLIASCLLFLASPYVSLVVAVTWRIDCLMYTLTFISILYFGIFSLKCPKCGAPIYIGDAFSILNCIECGSMLQNTAQSEDEY